MSERELGEKELEQEIERIDSGGDAWENTEPVEIEIKGPLHVVVPVRFASDTWQALHREARELGVGPSTLVRMWVLEKLRERVPTAKRE